MLARNRTRLVSSSLISSTPPVSTVRLLSSIWERERLTKEKWLMAACSGEKTCPCATPTADRQARASRPAPCKSAARPAHRMWFQNLANSIIPSPRE